MSSVELLKEVKSLPQSELQTFLEKLLCDDELRQEIERLGYLSLTEKSFGFWNDPREDIYQDYVPKK